MIASVLAPLMPATDRVRRAFMAEVLVHASYSMLNFSVSAGNNTAEDTGTGTGEDFHDATVRELKRMLTAYLWLAEKEAQTD